MFLIFIYVAVSALIGWTGRRCAIGGVGCFIFALLITPPVMALILLATRPDRGNCS